jgi:hypothetical protein
MKSDLHSLERLPVNSGDDRSLFRTKLEGAYDWIHVPQYYFKKLKKKVRTNV